MTPQEFEEILQKIVDNIKQNIDLKELTEKTFETEVSKELKNLVPDPENVSFTENSHAFPDIGYNSYGIEIKTTTGDKWSSPGNSIMEGTRRADIQDIYLMFLKKGGNSDIRFRPYNKVINDIKITHSPRFHIDMDTPEGDCFFSKINTTYDDFRQSEQKVHELKKYYRDNGIASWFLDGEEEKSTSVSIKPFSKLSTHQKQQIKVELICLFPEVASSNYDGVAAYLATRHEVYSSSLRDMFSAGGTVEIVHKGQTYKCSQLISHLIESQEYILNFFNENERLVQEEWDYDGDVFNKWKQDINTYLKSNSRLKPKEFDINWIF